MKFLLILACAAATVTAVLAHAASPPVLVAAVPLPGAPDGAQAYRIVYHSTDGGGVPIDVTGVVIVPSGPAPNGGRDIVAWAHGTSGIADACAVDE